MSIGVSVVCSGPVSVSALPVSVPLFAMHSHLHTYAHTHTRMHTACAHTRARHIQSSLSLSQTNTNTSRAPLFLPTNTLTQTHWMSMVESKHGPMKNACPFACFIRNTHRDSFPISAEIPHKNINYTDDLGGSVGRNGAQQE